MKLCPRPYPKRRRLLLQVLFLTISLLLPGCAKNTAQSKGEEKTLHLGVMYSADIVPLSFIVQNGLDQKYGFTLDRQVFSSARDRDAALQAGALDGVFTDFIGMCLYQNAGVDLKITGMTDGDYVLLASASSGIHSLDEAKGKSVAISENTLIEYTLDFILKQNGYEDGYLKKQLIPKIPERLELFCSGRVDLVLLPEPFSSLALKDGAVPLGSANSFDLYPAVSAFTLSSLSVKGASIEAFYRAYDEAADYINRTPVSELEAIVIQDAGFPRELSGQIKLPLYRKNALPDPADLISAIAWAAQRKLCDASLEPEDLLYSH